MSKPSINGQLTEGFIFTYNVDQEKSQSWVTQYTKKKC